MIEITSTSNQRIKDVAKIIKDNRKRQEEGVVVVDGKREIEEALRSGWLIEEFFYCSDFFKDGELADFFIDKSNECYSLSKKVFEKISYKKNPDGYLAIFKEKFLSLEDFKLKENPLILVLESVEKPGNLGAVIRTAYASGVDLIILNDQKTDIYSPNVIRSSTGFIFSMPLVVSSIDDTFDYLKNNFVNIYVTTLKGSKSHFDCDFKKSSAIIFGTESDGISDKWFEKDIDKVRIPMIKDVDSLNISVSAGIIIYEAMRQRDFFKNR
ncbi:MAG: RNA methyltransferase [Patescibacteria group bacterium]